MATSLLTTASSPVSTVVSANESAGSAVELVAVEVSTEAALLTVAVTPSLVAAELTAAVDDAASLVAAA
ncbi:hypothetical protein AYR55_00940 [Loigolactobacillus backii]|nr:hypothetical protein [Loigolactobacillus backii]ANK66395.1 hypothetical protein AYR55_00940 [Loigolactobacillus backii]